MQTPHRTRLVAVLKRPEAKTLAVWIALFGAPWLFFTVAEEVGEGETEAIDRALILAFRNPADLADPIGPRW